MVTIFSIPCSFNESKTVAINQMNAIKSWVNIPDSEVILFGNDAGVHDVCKDLNILHIDKIECNKSGTPMISDAFRLAQSNTHNDIVVYINADIIIADGFIKSIQSIIDTNINKWLAIGQRHDVDIEYEIKFDSDWPSHLKNKILPNSTIHNKSAIDYIIFPCTYNISLPPFAVGRNK